MPAESLLPQSLSVAFVGIAGAPFDFLPAPFVLLEYFRTKSPQAEHVRSKIFSYPQLAHGDAHFAARCDGILADVEMFLREQVARDGRTKKIVCFSCYTWNIDALHRVSAALKEAMDDLTIIWGGPEISRQFIIEGAYDASAADYLFHGEGEVALTKLLDVFVRGASVDLDAIGNLAHRRCDRYACTEVVNQHLDLGQSPSYILAGAADEVLARAGMSLNVETQRGCNFRCAYCNYHKSFPGIRYRDPQLVVREILHARELGCEAVRITDANFVSDKAHALAILNALIAAQVKMRLMVECLPQFVDPEIADAFGRYVQGRENRVIVGIGIQSLNEESMRTVRRSIRRQHFERAFQLLEANGVLIKSDIILGLPFETRESYHTLLAFVLDLQQSGRNLTSMGLLRILPGTDLVAIARETGLVYDPSDSEHYVYATPTMNRADMLHCLRLNTAVARVISARDDQKKMRLRDLYYRVKHSQGMSHVDVLERLASGFMTYLTSQGSDSDFCKPDFPDAEYYYTYRVDNEIPDDVVVDILTQIERPTAEAGEGALH
ncbi:MAG: radical SAM protein [Rhodopirellula sp.]|nr:radical SAM protein [Rhodopirellula sp.]